MKGYVVDHLSLTVGLKGAGSEYQRREFSRLIYSAAVGGPALTFPALCLAAAAAVRAAVPPHVAELIAEAQPGAIEVIGLTRSPQLSAVRQAFPALEWSLTHSVLCALMNGNPILTTDPATYQGIPVDIVAL